MIVCFARSWYISVPIWYTKLNCVVSTGPCLWCTTCIVRILYRSLCGILTVFLVQVPVCGMLALDDLCSIGEDWIKVVGVNPTFWLNYLFFTNPYHWNGTVGNNRICSFNPFWHPYVSNLHMDVRLSTIV